MLFVSVVHSFVPLLSLCPTWAAEREGKDFQCSSSPFPAVSLPVVSHSLDAGDPPCHVLCVRRSVTASHYITVSVIHLLHLIMYAFHHLTSSSLSEG